MIHNKMKMYPQLTDKLVKSIEHLLQGNFADK